MILTDKVGIPELLGKIQSKATQLNGYTDKLIFSFAEIAGYKKVGANLQRVGVNYREWAEKDMLDFAERLYHAVASSARTSASITPALMVACIAMQQTRPLRQNIVKPPELLSKNIDSKKNSTNSTRLNRIFPHPVSASPRLRAGGWLFWYKKLLLFQDG